MSERAAAHSRTPMTARFNRAAWKRRLAEARALWRLPFGLMVQRVTHTAIRPAYATGLYRRTLGRATGSALRCYPHDPWPGDIDNAQTILRGRLDFAGQAITAPSPLWHPPEASQAWKDGLHSFTWLRDLRQHNSDMARRTAREMVDTWMTQHPGPGLKTWSPATTGLRLASWLGQYGFFADSADVDFQGRLADSMTRQARHLARTLPAGLTGADLVSAIKGLIYAGLCLDDGERLLPKGIALLEHYLTPQIHVDGGHISRCPATHLRVLCDLLDMRATFASAGRDAPGSLVLGIENMMPTLKLFQHGDGGLALFNGGDEGKREVIDLALKRAGMKGKAHQAAPQSGFHRIEAGKTRILVEAGSPPPPGEDDHAHAGTLSFELSEGRRRIITNCGAQAAGSTWSRIARATAAHSTITVDETNSSELLPTGGLGRRPHNVICRREEADGAVLLDMNHDGYLRTHDIRHFRRLYLDAEGCDLRGEDVIKGPAGTPITARFHLHPDVQALLSEDGAQVHIRIPNGSGWRFQASGAKLDIDESIYLGGAGGVHRAQQIVLTTHTDPGRTVLKWAMKREAG